MTSVELLVLGAASALAVMGLALANIRLAIVLTMSAAAFTMTWNDIRLGSLTLSDYLLVATIGLVSISPIQLRPIRKLFGRSQKSLVLYAVLLSVGGLVGGVLRQQPDVGWDVALRFAASVLGIVFLVAALVQRRADFERYAVFFVLGAAVNGLVAISGGKLLAGRSIGLTNHPNHLGLATLLALFFAVATLGSPSRRVRYLTVGCLVPIIGAMVASGSRGAFLATSVGLLALTLMRRGRAVPWLLGLASMVIVLAFYLPRTLRTGTSALGRLISPTDSEELAAAERLSVYREASEVIQSSPVLGEGFARALVLPQRAVAGPRRGRAGSASSRNAQSYSAAGIAGRAIRLRCRVGPIMERACGAGLIATAAFVLVATQAVRPLLSLFRVDGVLGLQPVA